MPEFFHWVGEVRNQESSDSTHIIVMKRVSHRLFPVIKHIFTNRTLNRISSTGYFPEKIFYNRPIKDLHPGRQDRTGVESIWGGPFPFLSSVTQTLDCPWTSDNVPETDNKTHFTSLRTPIIIVNGVSKQIF